MAVGIFRVCLVLIAVVSINQLLFSEENGIVPENGEEILQRIKEQKVSLQLHQLCLEQEIAAQEARQKALETSALELERKIRWHTWKVLSLVLFALIKFCRHHLQEAICQHSREEETELFASNEVLHCYLMHLRSEILSQLKSVGKSTYVSEESI